jgi:hypothetical protein
MGPANGRGTAISDPLQQPNYYDVTIGDKIRNISRGGGAPPPPPRSSGGGGKAATGGGFFVAMLIYFAVRGCMAVSRTNSTYTPPTYTPPPRIQMPPPPQWQPPPANPIVLPPDRDKQADDRELQELLRQLREQQQNRDVKPLPLPPPNEKD